MPTKQFILQKAVASFPEYYEDFIKKNPQMKLSPKFKYPKIIGLGIDYIDRNQANKIELHLTVKKKYRRKNITFWLRGVCFADEYDADCWFVSGGPGTLRKFARIFTNNLLFNILSMRKINIADWNDFPDK